MNEAKRDAVQSWLHKSLHDILSASKLAEHPDPLFDTALYHCQQAAEKAMKGFLVFHDVRFEKTHDIGELVLEATKIEPSFSNWKETAASLTP